MKYNKIRKNNNSAQSLIKCMSLFVNNIIKVMKVLGKLKV